MVTLGDKLAASNEVGRGFDLMRISLSLGIVTWHSFAISRDGAGLEDMKGVWFFGYGMLCMFFALSGFLISASAQRLNLPNFLINRGLRIIPALFIEVLLSALILGVLFTNLGVGAYLSDIGTFRYFTNVVGVMNFKLPGVFQNNPVDVVNWSLWTVPYEYVCYGIMSLLILFGLLRKPLLVLAGAAFITLAGLALISLGFHPRQGEGGIPGKVAYFFFVDRGSRLLVSFMLGIAIYLFRRRIPYSRALAGICAASCASLAILPPIQNNYPLVTLLCSGQLAYLTVYLGISDLPTPAIFRRGDYSYGVYLYGMPIQQMMVAIFPSVGNPLSQLALAIPAILVFAAFSWHFIEKPILGMRRHFSFIARERNLGKAQVDQAARELSSRAMT